MVYDTILISSTRVTVHQPERWMAAQSMEVTMKRALMLMLVLLIAVFLFPQEEVKKEFRVKDGQTLTIDLRTGGSITIVGWKKNVLEINVDYRDDKVDLWNVTMEQTDEGVDVRSALKSRRWGRSNRLKSPDFSISVPAKFNLVVKTMGGSIALTGINGTISGRTMGGDLDLKQLKGEINLLTMGGNITLTDSDLDGKLRSMGGRVLFDNVVGDVSGNSMGGNVIMKQVTRRDGNSTGKVVNIRTMGGAIKLNEAPFGAKLHTMGGDIQVRLAKEFADVRTMGGDIEIKEIDGWIKATTMGGDIEITMVGDPDKRDRHVYLTSMGGDITLTLPAKLSMEVDIELAYTKNSERNYKIHSDFDLKIENTDQWDHKRSPRKYIYGTATISGGKHKVKIKTVNGHIYLKKK